jgi:hypothetical protein
MVRTSKTVERHFYTGSKASEIPEQKLKDLRNDTCVAIVKAISERYYMAHWPGQGIDRLV